MALSINDTIKFSLLGRVFSSESLDQQCFLRYALVINIRQLAVEEKYGRTATGILDWVMKRRIINVMMKGIEAS